MDVDLQQIEINTNEDFDMLVSNGHASYIVALFYKEIFEKFCDEELPVSSVGETSSCSCDRMRDPLGVNTSIPENVEADPYYGIVEEDDYYGTSRGMSDFMR